MQHLIIFIGDCNSEKDSLFKLLPTEYKEIVFEKLIIKEKIDQGETKLLLINFPDENEILKAFCSLLTLSEYFRIQQIVFCLKQSQTVLQRVRQIQNSFNQLLEQEIENIYTFFINNFPQNFKEEQNRIYLFDKIHESNKNNIIRILQDICSRKNTYSSYISQGDLQTVVLQQQESLKCRVNNMKKQFQEKYLSFSLENQFEINMQQLISTKPIIDICDTNIKQNQIILYSDAIYQLSQLKQCQIYQQTKFMEEWFKKVWYCVNCKVLLSEQENKTLIYYVVIYDLWLFQLDQKELVTNYEKNTQKCFRCSEQNTQKITNILPILEKIYIFQQIQKELKINRQFYIEANKQQIQNSKMQIKNKEDCIAIFLLSDEDELKQFVIQKVYDIKDYKERNQFKEGQILDDSFYLIDTPMFSFDEDSEKLESIYSNYINTNPIHFIIFCLKLQRSSLIKERLFTMLKKLPKTNKQAFGAFIINQNSDSSVSQSSEDEITKSIKGVILKTTLIQNNNTSMDVIKKISDFIINVDKKQPISFKQTIFHKQYNESDEKTIQTSLIIMSQNIQDQYQQNCEQEIKDEEAKLEYQEQHKKQLQQEISNLTCEFKYKQKELKQLIYSIQQELQEKEKNYETNLSILKNSIYQIKRDQINSIYNIKEKKSQLNQMEYEKKKKSQLNYIRKTIT